MKRILVVDESALVGRVAGADLGARARCVETSAGTHGLPQPDTAAKVDLLMLGMPPHYRWEAAAWCKWRHRSLSPCGFSSILRRAKARLRFGEMTKTTVGEIHAKRANRQTRSEW
mgnify:CR=1 FL=1